MTNLERAHRIVQQVRELGASDFCTCAGSRNSPLLAVLAEADEARLFSFVDERSAAFFALGRVKLQGRPAAVVTTSGTAVAELLPAVVEAYYSSLPLVLITADRPGRFHGSGAPQTIDQAGIFGSYAATSIESWDRTKPLHINIEFEEPLIDDVIPSREDGEESGR
ncbi:MAG: thiamine pyrophosphate-binding protein [Thermoanaerobaculia bacterium]